MRCRDNSAQASLTGCVPSRENTYTVWPSVLHLEKKTGGMDHRFFTMKLLRKGHSFRSETLDVP